MLLDKSSFEDEITLWIKTVSFK